MCQARRGGSSSCNGQLGGPSSDSEPDPKMVGKSLKILHRRRTRSDLHFRKPVLVTVQRMACGGARVEADEEL